MKKVGKIVAVVKENDQLQEIDFESGRVDTVDKVKADNKKNVALTSYVDYEDFNPENHKGQYVILENAEFDRGWDDGVTRVTLMDELISQMADSYLGPPDYFKRHLEPKVNMLLTSSNRCLWTATSNGYANCHLIAEFNEASQNTYTSTILVNDVIIFQHSKLVGSTRYELIQTIPVKKDDVIELIPGGNKGDNKGTGTIYFIPQVALSKSLYDRYYDELNEIQFNFKYNNNELFNINKWKVYNDVTFFGTATFDHSLLTSLSGNLDLEVLDEYGTGSKLVTFESDLYNHHSFVNNYVVVRNEPFPGQTCFTLDMEFYKKQAGSGGDVTVEVKLNRQTIENENI